MKNKILTCRMLVLMIGILTTIELWAKPGRVEQLKMPCSLLQGISEHVYSIYIPGSYDDNPQRQYPVLYLMHGGGESNTVWQRNGRLCELCDSLIGCRAMQEMIVVCPEGNQQNMMYFNAPQWKYEDYFFQELIPYIESNYRTLTERSRRAIAGFSMGGGAATVYGVHHPELFSMVCDISGYLRRQPLEFLKNDPSAEWRQAVIEQNNPILRIENGSEEEVNAWRTVKWFVTVGDHDFTLEGNMDLVKAFRKNGIPYALQVSDGEHNWKFVAPALERVLKQVFQQ